MTAYALTAISLPVSTYVFFYDCDKLKIECGYPWEEGWSKKEGTGTKLPVRWAGFPPFYAKWQQVVKKVRLS